ncbi:MAG: stalk domain-containing protein [Caldiserica bacterium]|nr:stalk domain-containing protein [Caldisericota bacterium]
MKRVFCVFLVFMLVLSIFSFSLTPKNMILRADESYQWMSANTGLRTNEIYSFAIDPTNTQVIYTGTYSIGVFKSTNGGTSWSDANTGITDLDIWTLAIDPTNTSTVYVTTWGGGVFKSTNGGTSWSAASTGLTDVRDLYVACIAIDPTNTSTLYAATNGGVFKSTNGGTSWSAVSAGLTSLLVQSLAIDPTNTSTLYATTNGGGVFKSTNGGTSWSAVNTGLADLNIGVLVIDPTSTSTLYAATTGQGRGGGVFKSTNGGTSWSAINAGLQGHFDYIQLAVDPTNTGIVYAGTWGGGIFKLTSGGTSWSGINAGLRGSFDVSALAVDPANTGIIYAGIWGGGIFKYVPQSSIPKYTITSSAGSGGHISPSGTVTVEDNYSETFTLMPDSGYRISEVKVDGVSKGSISLYTFLNITSNHVIEARFEREIAQTVIILQIGKSNFTVNGVSNTLDSPPVVKNSRTLLPIRAIIESLGGTVSWDATERKVTVSLGSTSIELWIGKSAAEVNGVDTAIDSTNSKVVPEIVNSRTMLPLRFVTENLGCDVQWDGTTKTITITHQAP